MAPGALECKVQVKATDYPNGRIAMSLSTLNRLIKAQLPAFICVMVFRGKEQPQEVYLIHIDDQIIEEALRKIRQAEAAGKANKIHKIDVRLKYSHHNKLSCLSGESLKTAIADHVPGGMEKYTEKKNRRLREIGFESGAGNLSVTFTVNEAALGEFVDMSLGKTDQVCLDNVVARNTRFGITAPCSIFEGGKLYLSFPGIKPFSQATLTFREQEFSNPLVFQAQLFVPPFGPALPKEFFKIRISNRFFEIFFSPFGGQGSFSVNLDDRDAYSLQEVCEVLRLFELLNSGKSELTMEIKPLALPIIIGKVRVNGAASGCRDVYATAEKAVSVCQDLAIDPSEVLVSLGDLSSSSQAIDSVFRMIRATPGSVSAEFSLDRSWREEGPMACVYFFSLALGDHYLGCHFAIVGTPELIPNASEANRYRLCATQVVRDAHPITEKEAIGEAQVAANFEAFSQQLRENTEHIVRIIR